MNGEIKLTCNGPKIEAEVTLKHVSYEDRLSLMNAFVSILHFNKQDLLLFLLHYDEIKNDIDETNIDLSALHGLSQNEAD